MALDHVSLSAHLTMLSEVEPPLKRAAYSDRTAWMMAVLAELAYERFEGAGENYINLAAELAKLTNRDEIARLLNEVSEKLRDPDASDTERLEATLKSGGFELVGAPIHDPLTDTQGYLAYRKAEDNNGMAVLVFRGTQQIADWKTNLTGKTDPVLGTEDEGGAELGRMHTGFKSAYLSVQKKVDDLIAEIPDPKAPLYICGHSLGGALAVVATWYLNSRYLAACYTFGAPRVGTAGLIQYYRTPIYRVVNGMDPVPNVPPSGWFVDGLMGLVALLGKATKIFGVVDWLLRQLITFQGYRHYGDIRYLTDHPPGEDGLFRTMSVLTNVSALERFALWIRAKTAGTAKEELRIDKYHDMTAYRLKLRAYALRRLQK